jgi:stress response protein YsnF
LSAARSTARSPTATARSRRRQSRRPRRAREAVVDKHARVVEEVAIRKDVEEQTETVRDTVRKTDVEVEQIPGQQQQQRRKDESRR